MKKVGINGFGRIGRMVFRAWLTDKNQQKDLQIVAVNNPLKKGQSIDHFVHMLVYDSVHGRLNMDYKVSEDGFEINGHKVKFHTHMDPSQIPWSDDQVEVVVDSTGIFKDKAGLGKHFNGTVKKVVMSAPGENLDATFVMGVNDHTYDPQKHHIVSNASCTTNCLAPVVKILDEKLGVVKGLVSTCHSYTNDQRVVDAEHDDLRRARAAALSMILTKTGAAKAIGEVLPHLKGKLDGYAIRVPTPNVSMIDLCVEVEKETTKEEVVEMLKQASKNELKGILDVSEKELVSVDFVGDSHSSIVDAKFTQVMGKKMVKVLAWYDNEWGYSCRVLDLMKKL